MTDQSQLENQICPAPQIQPTHILATNLFSHKPSGWRCTTNSATFKNQIGHKLATVYFQRGHSRSHIDHSELRRIWLGKCSKSVQLRAEVYMLKACDKCADMGQFLCSVPIP